MEVKKIGINKHKCLILSIFFESRYYCFDEKPEYELMALRPDEQGDVNCFDLALDELVCVDKWLLRRQMQHLATYRLNKSHIWDIAQYVKAAT